MSVEKRYRTVRVWLIVSALRDAERGCTGIDRAPNCPPPPPLPRPIALYERAREPSEGSRASSGPVKAKSGGGGGGGDGGGGV